MIRLAILLLTIFFTAPVYAEEDDPAPSRFVSGSGLPIPRFASLRTDLVNIRTGPGARYPVEWVFVRKSLPVEITAEYDTWRRIRDWEGTEGWVHQSMLSGKRYFVVTGAMRPLHYTPSENALPVAQLEVGVIGELRKCHQDWCQVRVNDSSGKYRGWLLKSDFWGAYKDEKIE